MAPTTPPPRLLTRQMTATRTQRNHGPRRFGLGRPARLAGWLASARLRCAAIALCAALCVPLLAACADGGVARDVTLAELVERPQAYDGRAVRTRGTVRTFDKPRHYWLEDADINRVGLEPMERIAPHLGREVAVTGLFSYSRDRGRHIMISDIEPFDTAR